MGTKRFENWQQWTVKGSQTPYANGVWRELVVEVPGNATEFALHVLHTGRKESDSSGPFDQVFAHLDVFLNDQVVCRIKDVDFGTYTLPYDAKFANAFSGKRAGIRTRAQNQHAKLDKYELYVLVTAPGFREGETDVRDDETLVRIDPNTGACLPEELSE